MEEARALGVVAALLLVGCLAPGGAVLPAGVGGGFSTTTVYAGAYDTSGPYSRVLVAGSLAELPEAVVTLDSPLDGTVLAIGLLRPDTPEPVPTIAVASAYFGRFEAGSLRSTMNEFPSPYSTVDFLADNFVPHGYAVALLAVRGVGSSGGCVDWVGERDRADLDAFLSWIASQSWSNGRVGMYGASHSGATQWAAAATGNPALRTIVPASTFPDTAGWLARNGSPGLVSPFIPSAWHATFGASPIQPLSAIAKAPIAGRDPARASDTACPSAANLARAAAHLAATGERSDPAWAERDHRALVLERYHGSAFVVGGFLDGLVDPRNGAPWADKLRSAGVPTKLLVGQWGHDTYANRADFAEMLLHWFDRWLKEDSTTDLATRVQVQDSEGNWRAEEAWPPRDAGPLALRLRADGALSAHPRGSEERRTIPVDATHALADAGVACSMCLAFRLAPSQRDLRFAGEPTAHLAVVPAGPGGSLAARLLVEDERGTRLLTTGVMDLRFAGGGDDPRDVSPGERLVARLALEPADAVVPAGATLVLEIAVSGHGRENAVNELGYERPASALPVDLLVGADASVLTLSTLTRGEDDFFDAP